MVMLWPDGDDFRLQSAMNLWVAETNYPGYKDLEELFIDKGPDQSSVKTIYNGWQFDTTEKIQKYKLDEWLQNVLRKQKIPVKDIKVNQSWCIMYEDGGYQHLHCHGPTLISMVIHLDTQPPLWVGNTKQTGDVLVGSDGNDKIVNYYGMLYSIMPGGHNEMIVNNWAPTPGQCVIFDGRVFHGVYPSKAGRRTVIVDFDFSYLDPDEGWEDNWSEKRVD
ncbi:uncharacterized protein METZ01_LOCUS178283 [marine metagenome]|uniref:Fe2OG dioxygenase domain-containing protein n=1 Tax=marine metagenome TaxID=408172 RepID=A0A382CHW8_9ZZZZ|tara:strand:+ start:152 stop:811 length:660 start_codon:yes stop_codon:yes gene_type:complete